MKTLRQKTLSLALFGLLAMNSGYSLLSQNENTYEGQVSFASVSTETIDSQLSDILDSSSYKYKALNISKSNSGVRTRYTIEGYKNLVSKDKKLLSKMLLDSNVELKIDDETGDAVLIYTHREIKTNAKVKVDNKSAAITSMRIGNIENGNKFNKGKAIVEVSVDTEGIAIGSCESCADEIKTLQFPVSLEDLDSIEALMAASQIAMDQRLEETKKGNEKRLLAKREKAKKDLERMCLKKDNPSSLSKSDLRCISRRLEDRDPDLNPKLSDEEKDKLKEILATYIKGEYKDHPKTKKFKKYLKGNPEFIAVHKEARRDALQEVAEEEKYERQRARTEQNEEALKNDLDWLEDSIYEWENLNAQFENLYNYANRDLANRQWQCDSYSGYYPNQQNNYFGNQYSAGVSFNNRDGFNTWAGNTNSRAMTTMPGVNMMGGNNQFMQTQQQTAQILRQNCMQNVQTAQNYWNWELGNLENGSISPLEQSISTQLRNLNLDRIFPTTYSLDDQDNGGLLDTDKEYYSSIIQGFNSDLKAMGFNTNVNSGYSLNNNGSSLGVRNNLRTNNNNRLGNTSRGIGNTGIQNRNRGGRI
ncbi:MAG: hypothetical protein VX642_04175 [Bdellovibrionota bacterium]|nr:hypothetical protein [Bdellovibrionota bacterium]